MFNVTETAGIKNPNGTFFTVGQPISNISNQNQVAAGAFPLFGQWIDPRLQQPYQMQSNVGYSQELNINTVVTVDYVNSLGRDLNFRPRVNQRIRRRFDGAASRRRSSRPSRPNTNGNRPTVSRGESEYNALIMSVRRRLSHGVDFTAAYTLQKGISTIGNAADELNTANIQDPNNPFDDPRQLGPNATTDARHLINFSATFQLPWGFRVAPIFFYRSALPVNLVDGRDLNLDGDAIDIPAKAYQVDKFDSDPTTLADQTYVRGNRRLRNGELRPRLQARRRPTFVLEGVQPEGPRAGGSPRRDVQPLQLDQPEQISAHASSSRRPASADPALLEPTTFSGDFRRPEQRVGQLGLRFSF